MRFKEYFLLRESPDTAKFFDPEYPNSNITRWVDYLEKGYKIKTGIMTDKIMYNGPTNNYIHSSLMMNVAQDVAYDQPMAEGISSFGTSDPWFVQICKTLNSELQANPNKQNTIFRRNVIITDYPNILMYRSWEKNNKINFSFWNYNSDITSTHKSLIAKYIKSLGYNPSESMFEVEETPIWSKDFFGTDSSSNEKNTDYVPSDAIHMLPPEQKKAALLAAGARPKVNTPIQNRKIRSGD